MVVDQLSLGLGRLQKFPYLFTICLDYTFVSCRISLHMQHYLTIYKTIFTVIREVKKAKVCCYVYKAMEMSHDLSDYIIFHVSLSSKLNSSDFLSIFQQIFIELISIRTFSFLYCISKVSHK